MNEAELQSERAGGYLTHALRTGMMISHAQTAKKQHEFGASFRFPSNQLKVQFPSFRWTLKKVGTAAQEHALVALSPARPWASVETFVASGRLCPSLLVMSTPLSLVDK